MADDRQDRFRTRIGWLITGVWIICFPLSILVPSEAASKAFIYVQPPMMFFAGWLFAVPLIRRNGGEE